MTDEVKKKMGDVINLLCAELGFTKPIDILRCSAAVTDLYHDLEKQNELLRKYITRGGFIQDCHGKWCKEGDKVRYKRPDPFGKPNTFIERTAILEYTEGQHFKLVDEIALFSDYIELIEPCEPDICKDFEGEEL